MAIVYALFAHWTAFLPVDIQPGTYGIGPEYYSNFI